jgi:hypothetical protein
MTRSRTFQTCGYHFAIIACVLLLAGFVIAPVSGFSNDFKTTRPTPIPTKTAEAAYMDLAKQILIAHPEIQTMSDMEKAKYAFNAYSQDLWNKNLPVNANLAGRVPYGGDYTCVWHTENLQAILRTFGVTEVHSILADKNSYNFLDVNRNHQAVLVIIDGKPYVFDMWKMAVENNGEYKNDADSDKFNGMPLDDWNAYMKEDNYVRFTADSETVDPGADVWYPSALTSAEHMKLTHATTTLMPSQVVTIIQTTPSAATGSQTVTITSQGGVYTQSFTVPATTRATGLKVTYDFSSAKPGFGAFDSVSLDMTDAAGTSTGKTLWSTTLYGDGWGSNSGTTKTEGSLDNLVLSPGSYSFSSSQELTSPMEQTTPLPATLSYTISPA